MPSGLTGEGSSPLPGAYPVSTQSVAARRPAPGPTDLPLITHIRHSPKSVFPDSDRGPRGRRARLPPPTFHATTPSTHPTGVLPTRRAPIVSPHSDAGPVPTVGHGTGADTPPTCHQPHTPPPSCPPSSPRTPMRGGTHGEARDGRGYPHQPPCTHTRDSPNPSSPTPIGDPGADGRGYPQQPANQSQKRPLTNPL